MPVAVANATNTVVILSNPDGESLEWDYRGAPSGADIQEIPEKLWESARMRRAKNRGILSETSTDALDQAYAAQRDHIAKAKGDRMDEVQEALTQGTPNQTIIISADDMDMHVGNKVRDGELLEKATAAAEVRAQEQETALVSSINPMAAVNAAAE